MSPPARSLDRLNAADIAALLERFGGQDMLSRGGVNIISLAAIRDRAGERWPRKRPDVWAYAEKKLAEHLTFQDVSQRIGETDYLIAMTSEDGIAAQTLALRILEEVLLHFLGAAEPRDMAVRTVTDLSGGTVNCAPLDPTALRKAAVARPAPPPPPPVQQADVDPVEERKRNPYVFSTGAGIPMRIDFAVERITSLRHGATAALRIEPTVTETVTGRVIPVRAFGKLADADLFAIDQALLDYASLYLARLDSAGAPALIVPVSFRSMASARGRQMLISLASDDPARVKSNVLVELVDIDRGTPGGRLVEVCALLRTLCRGIFARMHPMRPVVALLKDARLQGVTVDVGDLSGDEARLTEQILDFGRQARGLGPAVVVQGLPSEIFLAIAETAGVTHAGLRAPPSTAKAA